MSQGTFKDRLARPAEPTAKEKPSSYNLRVENSMGILAKPKVTPPELISGILHLGSKMVLGGGSKTYKTWGLMDLALSVATGAKWWGFDTIKGPVLYLNFELQDWLFKNRLHDLIEAKNCPDPEFLDISNLRGHPGELDKIADAIILLGKVKRYMLIVLDPIYKCLGRLDENKAGDMAQLHFQLDRISNETGASVVYGAHYSKGNQAAKEAIDRIAGSGVTTRDADSILTLTRHEENDESFTVDLTLRGIQFYKPFVVRRSHPLMIRDEELDPENLKGASGRGAKVKYEDGIILQYLAKEGMRNKDWRKSCHDECGMGLTVFETQRRKLEDTQRIVHTADGKGWIAAPTPAVATPGGLSFAKNGHT